MLVLVRKPGEAVVVPHCGIKLTVLEIDRGRVRLGVTGPPEVVVHREEVWLRILQGRDNITAPSPGVVLGPQGVAASYPMPPVRG
jgi:carbon storage regulator